MSPALRAPRGQNLVLLALTMLFLALMVTMTLGLGMRIRQKHELQNLADAAAYSNAVMEARAFNNAALINRLEVSYWVAIAADQSLISWTSYGRGMVAASRSALSDLASCNSVTAVPLTETQVRELRADLASYSNTAFASNASWDTMDKAAGNEARGIQGMIAGLRSELSSGVVSPEPLSVAERLFDRLKDQTLTKQVILASGQTDVDVLPVTAPRDPAAITAVNRREVDCDFASNGNGPLDGFDPLRADGEPATGLCNRASWSITMEHAAMGTRGPLFLRARSVVPPKVAKDIADLDANYDRVSLSFGGKNGSGYWSTYKSHGGLLRGKESWADDDGTVTASAAGCSVSKDVRSHVQSTHIDDDNDSHSWNADADDPGVPEKYHTMGSCQPLCPSVWVRTVGFRPNNDPGDAFGQPKTQVALQRDLSAQTFPWELHFSFPFSATGTPREWDARGRQLKEGTGAGLDIRYQTAWSTGIIYYHRTEHWDEFPNLLNPFWRATLAPVDVDDQGPTDVRAVLNQPGHRWQGRVWQELVRAGYKGLH